MTRLGELLQYLCGRPCGPRQRVEQGRADKLIDESEKTREELAQITRRLVAHVAALKTLTRTYAHRHQD